MKRKKVVSSNIKSIGYDEINKVLEIGFNQGVYQYFDVPLIVFKEFMVAKSYGKYFASHIKKAGYKYKKVGI